MIPARVRPLTAFCQSGGCGFRLPHRLCLLAQWSTLLRTSFRAAPDVMAPFSLGRHALVPLPCVAAVMVPGATCFSPDALQVTIRKAGLCAPGLDSLRSRNPTHCCAWPSSEGPDPCRIRGFTALLAAGVEPDTGLLHLMAPARGRDTSLMKILGGTGYRA